MIGWLTWCGVQVATARQEARNGVDELRAARASLDAEALVRGDAADALGRARHQLRNAHRRVDSALLAPLRYLPVLGRQLDSVRALTAAGAGVTDIGLDAMAQFRASAEGAGGDPARRVAATVRLGEIAGETARRVAAVDLGPRESLFGALADARAQFADIKERLAGQLSSLQTIATGVHSFLAGPTDYLLIAANNAEMRGGTGMFLSAGPLSVAGGRLQVGDMASTVSLRVPGRGVEVGGDLGSVWGWTGPGIEWRNLAMSPRFDASAELAARMWAARTGRTVGGVMVIDPVAIRALLSVAGPVTVEGRPITADTLYDELFVEQYRGIDPRGPNPVEAATVSRRNRLNLIARAVLERFEAGGWDAPALLAKLSEVARGRHVLCWSSDPIQMAGWRAAGLTGELSADSMALSLLSQGGTKIDGFIPVEARLSRQGSAYTVTVTVTNNAPDGLPWYVQGPTNLDRRPGFGVGEGEYAGIVALNVPGAANALTIDGDPPLVAQGRDGLTRVVGTRVRLARWGSTTLTFRFDLPDPASLVVEPSARLQPIHWITDGGDWWDTRPMSVGAHR